MIKIETSVIKKLTTEEQRKEAKKIYKKFLGKTFLNKDRKIVIEFIGDGMRKISNGGKMYSSKIALLNVVPKVIEEMKFSNFGVRKVSDKINVLGYLNFMLTIILDGKKSRFKIAIQLRNNGKFYYSHDNYKKKCLPSV